MLMIVMVDVNSLVETFSWQFFCKSKGVFLVARFRKDMLFTIHNQGKRLGTCESLGHCTSKCGNASRKFTNGHASASTGQRCKCSKRCCFSVKKTQLRLFQLIFILRIDEMRSTFSIGSVKHANKIPLQSYFDCNLKKICTRCAI